MSPFPPTKKLSVLLALISFHLIPCTFAETRDGNWKLASRGSQIEIYSRPRPGSAISEIKAIGEIAAPPFAVQNVLDDRPSYPRFMPYVVECKLLSNGNEPLVVYQHLAPPIVSARDYTIRIFRETSERPGGTQFATRWESANALGPAERPGIVRVKINEGSWRLEPAPGGTHATYCLFTDSGGALPGFIANKANQIAVGKLFEAIRKQVKDPKYQTPR